MNEHSQHVIEKLRALKPVFKDMNIKRLRVFGSVARGEAEPESDVDLIIDFFETPGLIKFIGIKDELQDRIGIKIDLVTERGLHRALKDDILAEARDV